MKKLGFGLMRLPLLDPDDERSVDIETFQKMADAFLGAGFTYFDTAALLSRGPERNCFSGSRDKAVSPGRLHDHGQADPVHGGQGRELPGFFQGQLERLGVDFIDYYWIHGLQSNCYPQAQQIHAFEFVKKLKDEGKVKHIGFSFHGDAKLLEEILTRYPYLEYVQIQLNYLDWEDENVQSRLCYETATRHGKPVIVMEPVKGGCLASIPEAAEKTCCSSTRRRPPPLPGPCASRPHPENIMVVLSGMSNEAQMADN